MWKQFVVMLGVALPVIATSTPDYPANRSSVSHYWASSVPFSMPVTQILAQANETSSPETATEPSAGTPDEPAELAQNTPSTTFENAAPSPADSTDPGDADDTNVNDKYLVESVKVVYQEKKSKKVVGGRQNPKLSTPLRQEIDGVVGQRFDLPLLRGIADQIKNELKVPNVDVDVSRGATRDHVVVQFLVGEQEKNGFDLDLQRFLYHSKQGWTGQGTATVRIHGNAFSFGLVSDADRLAERYAGIQAGYERQRVGTDRLDLRFDFFSYHQQWNLTSLQLAQATNPGAIYRTRQHFIPKATFYIAKDLALDFGVDFARYRIAVPSPVGFGASERTESSNAVVSTLRYHQRWDSDTSDISQELIANYGIRSGTGFLESDRIFTKHQTEVTYIVDGNGGNLKVTFLAGRIGGSAPVFEQFIMGNTELLRGWNKFDLAPLGASRAVHGSIDYSYHHFLVFYDTGALWTLPQQRVQRQSLGLGFTEVGSSGFQMALAFPVRSGRAAPIFYVGMNF